MEEIELIITEYKVTTPPISIPIPEGFEMPKLACFIGHLVEETDTNLIIEIDSSASD